MILLLVILAAARAYPAGLQSPPVLSLDPIQSSYCEIHHCRSLWDIIRSCALTIFLCTWVSVHPNIPSPEEGWPKVTLRRVGLMLATLVVPEAIIAWALRQRLTASEQAKNYKREGWSLTHGFFATMGGFIEYEGNRPIRVLLPWELESYSLTGNGDFPRLSKMEIQDKSKGDFISKAVVILQTSWFVIQCIARGAQGLPITELELATIAFAGLNFVIYLLWWDKPLNVRCGVRVYKKRITDSPVNDGYIEARAGFWVALGDALSRLPAAIVHGPVVADTIFHSDKWPWTARILAWPVIKPFEIIVGGYNDRVGKRVGTFYPCEWDEYQTHIWPLAMVIAGTASAFGGIHCFGWSFTFPSSTERTLWRLASISITSVPIALFLPIFLIDCDLLPGLRRLGGLGRVRRIGGLGGLLDWLFDDRVSAQRISRYYSGLLLFLYVLSRLVLLILPFLGLRSLPPVTYHTVDWTSFLPHI